MQVTEYTCIQKYYNYIDKQDTICYPKHPVCVHYNSLNSGHLTNLLSQGVPKFQQLHYSSTHSSLVEGCTFLQPLFVFDLSFFFHSHYFVHGGWFEDDNHVLNRVATIRHIPATIVQGRYDLITPMKTAWELHKVSNSLCLCLL